MVREKDKLDKLRKAEGGYMRALECDCGQHLEAADDQKLFDEVQKHLNRDHPEMRLSAERVREIVTEKAYDKRDILAGIDIPPRAAAYMGAGGMPPSSATPEPPKNDRTACRQTRSKKGRKDW
jgi:hypothetical protein